jgi:hypothetical protein
VAAAGGRPGPGDAESTPARAHPPRRSSKRLEARGPPIRRKPPRPLKPRIAARAAATPVRGGAHWQGVPASLRRSARSRCDSRRGGSGRGRTRPVGAAAATWAAAPDTIVRPPRGSCGRHVGRVGAGPGGAAGQRTLWRHGCQAAMSGSAAPGLCGPQGTRECPLSLPSAVNRVKGGRQQLV